MEPKDMKLTAATLAHLIDLVAQGKLNRNTAVKVFDAVFDDNGDVDAYVKEHGLEQVSDTGLVEEVVARVLEAKPQSVADYKGGKEKAFGFLVGQTMKELKGKADPKVVNAVLRQKLDS
jgi:aspartyl-tRNA(Asn)/glutamyl-tRNA(Gln) amidotransferase subunit B